MASAVPSLVVRVDPGPTHAVIFLIHGDVRCVAPARWATLNARLAQEETSFSVGFASAADDRRIVAGDRLAGRLLDIHGDAIQRALRASSTLGELSDELALLAVRATVAAPSTPP